MQIISQDVRLLLRHLVGNFIAAAVVLAMAIGLAFIERWCADLKMPEYVCYGTRAVAFTLFSIDGVAICGTAAIVTLKLLRRTWQNEQ